MAGLSRPGTWYLFDYGMVISTAPTDADWQLLERETGLDLRSATSPYWAHREDFDGGRLTPASYWAAVLGAPEVPPDRVELLEALDATQWAHLNPSTLEILATLSSEGANLALLSNMPAELSARYLREAPWAGYFRKTYFSGHLQLTKPDRRIFEHVLRDLGAAPENVVFIDDNAANIAAAQELGLRTIHFLPPGGPGEPTDLRRLLPEV